MQLLGIDLGSSSVKTSIIDAETGEILGTEFYPETEAPIDAKEAGWAEQSPTDWWIYLTTALKKLLTSPGIDPTKIKSIGISYQMHGLVAVDKDKNPVRPSIIWCDSRAVPYGDAAFNELGSETCLEQLLNSPGNFTASKLKWVKENEPEVFNRIDKIMLPGDYLAMKLSGITSTTVSGLSEGMLWNFKENKIASFLIDHLGFEESIIPELVPTFGFQGTVLPEIAQEFGLSNDVSISYRAGDQPNNAFSLNVLQPGEVAATAGTSGVVYGVSEEIKYDPLSRVNTFAHVNHGDKTRLGVLLCVNGTGIQNAYIKHNIAGKDISYPKMNDEASTIQPGSDGLILLPFGNGAERMLSNKNIGAQFLNIDFNRHTKANFYRAAQEGIAFAFKYGMDIMETTGIDPKVIRAGNANMFLSPIFRETLSTISGCTIELYDTDGSVGAARGGGLGSGVYKNSKECFKNLNKIKIVTPNKEAFEQTNEAYNKWVDMLSTFTK